MLTVNSEVTEELWREWLIFIGRKNQQSNQSTFWILFAILGIGIAIDWIILDEFSMATFLTCMTCVTVWAFLLVKLQSRGKHASDYILAPRLTTIRDEGLCIESKFGTTIFFWSGIFNIEESKNLFFIMFDNVNCIPIPFDCFESDAHEEEFVEALWLHCQHLKRPNRDQDYDDYRD